MRVRFLFPFLSSDSFATFAIRSCEEKRIYMKENEKKLVLP